MPKKLLLPQNRLRPVSYTHLDVYKRQGFERADQYFILKDFRSYEAAQKKVEEAYRDEERWAKMAMLQTAKCGKFSSDRTIEEYAKEIWHLEKVTL